MSQLPEWLKPPRDGSRGLRDEEAAVKCLPLDLLPRRLLPKLNRVYQPPVFYLGYLVDEEAMARYSKKYNLEESLCRITKTDAPDYNEAPVLEAIFKHMVHEAGATTFEPVYSRVGRHSAEEKGHVLMTISSSFHGRPPCKPTMEDVVKLREFLGEPEFPKWYISAFDGFWGPRPFYYRG